MPESEKKELLAWEKTHLGHGTFATSDWPGWEKYIGEPPVYTDENRLRDRYGYIYLVRIVSGEYKIGRSKDVRRRIKGLGTSSPHALELIHQFPADDASKAESVLHQYFSEKSEVMRRRTGTPLV